MADALSRNYAQLKGPERFTLMLEAMARGDEPEADRLEDTCPQLVYRMDDLEFRDRMKRAYMIASMVSLNLRGHLAQIRAAVAFRELYREFAWGPTLVATSAFLYGREYGRWECGAIEQIDLPDQKAMAAEMRQRPDLRDQLRDLRETAAEAVKRVAEELKCAMGEAHAVQVLSQWEGFGRFSRSHLGAEPLTVTRAYRMITDDPAAEVLAAYPDAAVDEAKAAEWEANWARKWERRFDRPR